MSAEAGHSNSSISEHITPVLRQLYRLPVRRHVEFGEMATRMTDVQGTGTERL